MDQRSKCKTWKPMKPLEENIGKHCMTSVWTTFFFFDKTSKVQKMKVKIDKNDIRWRSFHTAQEIIDRGKKQSAEGEKNFANYTSKKDQNLEYIKNLKILNYKKLNVQLKKRTL
jgi:hypothetical protein